MHAKYITPTRTPPRTSDFPPLIRPTSEARTSFSGIERIGPVERWPNAADGYEPSYIVVSRTISYRIAIADTLSECISNSQL